MGREWHRPLPERGRGGGCERGRYCLPAVAASLGLRRRRSNRIGYSIGLEAGAWRLEDADLLMVASVAFVPVLVSWKGGNQARG